MLRVSRRPKVKVLLLARRQFSSVMARRAPSAEALLFHLQPGAQNLHK